MQKSKKQNSVIQQQGTQPEFEERVVEIKRVSKKTKGGDRLGFTVLAVVGDQAGQVGVALSRAPAVVSAIQKAMKKAKKNLISFPIVGEAQTIPHQVEVKNGASQVLLKPAPAGTSVRAGGPVRPILEVAGVKNVVAKILGSDNVKSNVDTTLMALKKLKSPELRKIKTKSKSKKK